LLMGSEMAALCAWQRHACFGRCSVVRWDTFGPLYLYAVRPDRLFYMFVLRYATVTCEPPNIHTCVTIFVMSLHPFGCVTYWYVSCSDRGRWWSGENCVRCDFTRYRRYLITCGRACAFFLFACLPFTHYATLLPLLEARRSGFLFVRQQSDGEQTICWRYGAAANVPRWA